jgi:hypothetical protein
MSAFLSWLDSALPHAALLYLADLLVAGIVMLVASVA